MKKETLVYRLNLLFQRYFPVFLVAGVLLGIGVPETAFALKRIILICLAVLVFFPALRMNKHGFTSNFSLQLRVLVVSSLVMFGLIPLLMYSLGRMANLDNALLVGLVLASAAPSMISSPYFTGLMNGNMEVAFSISVFSTMLSPFVVPYTLYLLIGENTTISIPAVARTIFFVIIVPAALAALIRYTAPKFAASFLATENLFTVSAIVLINWVIVGTNQSPIVNSMTVVLLPLLALGLVQDFGIFFLTRKVSSYLVPEDISKALAVSFGLKNVALVGGVIVTFSESMALASGVVSLAHVLMFIVISLWKDRL
jgi:predicted Na+-dependent transporter